MGGDVKCLEKTKPSSQRLHARHPDGQNRGPCPCRNPQRPSNLDLGRSWGPEDVGSRWGRRLPDFAPGGAGTRASTKGAVCRGLVDRGTCGPTWEEGDAADQVGFCSRVLGSEVREETVREGPLAFTQ